VKAAMEYAGMGRGELEDKLTESRKELFNLCFQKATGQLDNTARIGLAKREIARLLTVLRQRDLEADLEIEPRATSWVAGPASSAEGTGDEEEA